jgi:hypothetical protein
MDSGFRMAVVMALERVSQALERGWSARSGLCKMAEAEAVVADIAALSTDNLVLGVGREIVAVRVIDIAVGIVMYAIVAPVEGAGVAGPPPVGFVTIARPGSEDTAVVVVVVVAG